ncbi:MAG TPA: DUF2087 domain-containing protein [Pseudonocardiaceae bacterium]
MTSGDVTPEAIVGLLAEPRRLRVFAAVVLGAGSAAELREATGLDQRAVGTALRKLEDGGIVGRAADGGYVPLTEPFVAAARRAAPPPESHGYTDERVESVLRAFVRDGRLTGMPAQAGRRRVLLEHVALSFEPGVDYPEKEVNAILRAWVEGGPVDHVSVRRYLVDEQLLSRQDNNYRRSGGWVAVLGGEPG